MIAPIVAEYVSIKELTQLRRTQQLNALKLLGFDESFQRIEDGRIIACCSKCQPKAGPMNELYVFHSDAQCPNRLRALQEAE